MKIYLYSLLFIFTLSAQAQSIQFKFNLTPAGSFSIKADTIIGKITKKDNGYIAKQIRVDLSKISSGIDLRDKHIKDRLRVKKHPYAILEKAVALKNNFTAIIRINGVRKKVKGTYQADKKQLEGKFSLKMSDFKLPPASYLGIGVSDEFQGIARWPLKKLN